MSDIVYKINTPITKEDFLAVLQASTLSNRRPVEDVECLEGMVNNANLTITAWHGSRLVGIARAVTDFYYCCYLSDLAVDRHYQNRGLGRQLLKLTKQQLQPKCNLILLSAPAATDYYPHIGFQKHSSAWVLYPGQQIL